jgi:hypothetical protein
LRRTRSAAVKAIAVTTITGMSRPPTSEHDLETVEGTAALNGFREGAQL